MKRNLFATLGAVVAVALIVGCVGDPTASLRGGVDKVLISLSHVELDQGATRQLQAKSYDAQGNVLKVLPEITAVDPTMVSITVDSFVTGDPLPRTHFTIEALAAGSTELIAKAGGVESPPTTVIAYPLVFDGAISVDQTGPNDILTISSTSVIQFTGNSTVLLGGGQTYMLSRSADQLQVQSLSLEALTDATVTISSLLFLGSSEVEELDASTPVSVRAEANEPANDDTDTAPVITPGFTALGAVGDGGYDSSDWFTINLAAATDVTFTVSFPEATDIDLELYDTSFNRITESWYDNPEQIQINLAAGTYYVLVYLYATDDPDPIWYDFSYTSP